MIKEDVLPAADRSAAKVRGWASAVGGGGAELLGGSGGREQCLGLDFDFSQLRGRDAF